MRNINIIPKRLQDKYKRNQRDPDGDFGKVQTFDSDWRDKDNEKRPSTKGWFLILCVLFLGKEDVKAIEVEVGEGMQNLKGN